MKTAWTIQSWTDRFEENQASARVCEFGVLILLGLIGITNGRG